MYQQAVPYVLSMSVAGVVSLVIAFYAWSRRPAPGAASLALLMLSAAAFSLPYAMQVGSADLQTALFWWKVCFPGGVLISPAWLVFALQYTGREKWLTRRNLALLAIVPVMSVLLGWTNEFHGLYGSDFRMETGGPFPVLGWTHGVGFWVHFVYAYLVTLFGTLLLIGSALRMSRLYRTQMIWLLIGTFAPLAGNLIFALGLSPIPQTDLSPFAFTITGLAWGWGLFRHRLLDIVPVARDAIIRSMDDSLIVLDAQNRIVDLNPAAGRIIGRSAAETIGQPAAQVLSAWPNWLERYGDVTEASAEIFLGEGEARRFYDVRVSPLHDRRGRLTGRLVVLRDITERKRTEEELRKYRDHLETLVEERTAELKKVNEQLQRELTERKRAEKALRESESHYRAVVEDQTEMISRYQPDNTLTFVNDAFCIYVGKKREELIGQSWEPLVPEENREMVKKLVASLDRNRPVDTFEQRSIGPDGEIRWEEWTNRAILDEQGQITEYQGIGRDITERKRAEEERERLLAELEAKNRELESFVYTVSHDLKAPLVSLGGFSSALQKEFYNQLGEEGKHYLERIQANVAHMDTLIVHLLELSRIGWVIGPVEEIDVAALLREVQEDLAVELEEAGAEFVVQEPLPAVRADRGRIRQVFANLIDNAVKFRSEERPLRIEVGCQEEEGFHRFHVADNGIGIAPQYQEQIFGPFQQLDAGTEGVGMGLALVNKIVEHHDGRVWVESESGKGSTFYFTIPVISEQ